LNFEELFEQKTSMDPHDINNHNSMRNWQEGLLELLLWFTAKNHS